MSDGIGDISYNTPSVSGAVPPFVNLAGARNGLTVDAGSFVVLGQDPGQAGDPGAILGDREIPMPDGSTLRLSAFDADPNRVLIINPEDILFFYDSDLGIPSIQMLDVNPVNQIGSRFFAGSVELTGNSSINAPAKIDMIDAGTVIPVLTLTANLNAGQIGGWTLFYGNQSSQFAVINFDTRGTLQIDEGNVGNVSEQTALLQLDSARKGFLLSRMTTVQKNSIVAPATALKVFDTTVNKESIWKGAFWVDQKDIFAGSFSQAAVAATVFTVTFGVTLPSAAYQVAVTPTAALSAALFFVTNKTTTTFQVVYLAGLTGTVTFDWEVIF